MKFYAIVHSLSWKRIYLYILFRERSWLEHKVEQGNPEPIIRILKLILKIAICYFVIKNKNDRNKNNRN